MPRAQVIAALALLCACGETRDVYEIVASLESNTCGVNAQPLEDGLRYRTQLKLDPPRASWRVLPKGGVVDGEYDPNDGALEFRVTQRIGLDPGIDGGVRSCTLLREETITGVLVGGDAGLARDGGGDEAAPLTGEHKITFRADPEGTCAGATGPLGPFERVPCEARYSIEGEPKPDG